MKKRTYILENKPKGVEVTTEMVKLLVREIVNNEPFDPSNYDLTDFTNEDADPFVRESELPSSGGGSYTDEQAQDAVGGILTDTNEIDFTYDDTTPSITANLRNNSIANSRLEHITANHVKGRLSGNGVVQDIAMADLPISTAVQNAFNALPIVIADSTPSAFVTTVGVSTIVKTYNLPSLVGKKVLRFNFKAFRTVTGANARIIVNLVNTITNSVISLGIAQTTNTATQIFNCKREHPINQESGFISIISLTPFTDDGGFSVPLTNVPFSTTQLMQLQVMLLDSSATVNIQIYSSLIEIF